jgi:hypothetical protein
MKILLPWLLMLPAGVRMPGGNPGSATVFNLDRRTCTGTQCR